MEINAENAWINSVQQALRQPLGASPNGGFAFNHDKRNKLLGFFQFTWIFQMLEFFFFNLYAQCRRGGKDQTIRILNCGQDIVLISSLFSKWKTR